MTFELSVEQVGIVLSVLGTVVGYLARTKADVIILKRDVRAAHKRIDSLNITLGIGRAESLGPKEHLENEK
jgi:hypothetical protein